MTKVPDGEQGSVMQLDRLDLAILGHLQAHGRATSLELSEARPEVAGSIRSSLSQQMPRREIDSESDHKYGNGNKCLRRCRGVNLSATFSIYSERDIILG
jgi:hypothetical protein